MRGFCGTSSPEASGETATHGFHYFLDNISVKI